MYNQNGTAKRINDSLLGSMDSTITSAKEFVIKVLKIKNCANCEKVWSLENIEELICGEKKVPKEIDLSETVDFLTNLKQEITNKKELVHDEGQVLEEELIQAREFFNNLPMNFETELTIVNEKLNNAEKFNGHVENSKHDLNNEFDNLVTQYQKLNVRLTEFEDLINRVNQDKAIIKDIEDFLGEKSEQENQKYQLGDYEKLKEFRLNIAKISSLNKTVV